MQFTGINYRSVPSASSAALNCANFTIFNSGDMYNPAGASGVHFGFSGSSENISFLMRSGKIYDPQGRVVYGYKEDSPFSFDLKFNSSNYEYKFNDILWCSNSSKNSFAVNKFFINCNGVTVDGNFSIFQENISYDITYPETYSTSNLNITFANNSNKDIKIFSAEIIFGDSSYYSTSLISNITVSANSSGVLTLVDNSGQIGASTFITLRIYTNFGDIDKNIESLRI